MADSVKEQAESIRSDEDQRAETLSISQGSDVCKMLLDI